MKRLITCIVLLLITSSLHAQERDTMQNPTQYIETVTVQGRRSVPSIIPAQTLSGAELEKLNANSVADAIRYFSGVQIKDYGGIGGLKTVNI